MKYLLILLLVPCWVLAQTAQLDVTGNLVNNTTTATPTTSTWQNVHFDTVLQCWAPGDPGYCGPNPTLRPGGSINFSYGYTDIWQKVNVAKALPYGGTGLVTTGFIFGWTSKNGNGWDDGRLDQLNAYVKLYSSGDSKVLETFNWNLNYIHDWTTFSINKDWANTKIGYRENQLGNVQYGFVGMDNNYWAGPYGPEVINVNFQLKYKPDPCKNNPLYSPECPNFSQELQKANATIIPEASKQQIAQTEEQKLPPPEHRMAKEELDFGDKPEGASEHYFDSDRLEATLTKIFTDQLRQEEHTLEVAQEAIDQTERTSDRVTKQAESIARDSQQRSIRESLEIKQDMQANMQQRDRSQDGGLATFQGPNISTSITAFTLPGPQLNQFSLQQHKDVGQPEQSPQQVQQVQQQQQTQLQFTLNSIAKVNLEQQAIVNPTSVQQQTQAVHLYTAPQIQQQVPQPSPQTTSISDNSIKLQQLLPPQQQSILEQPVVSVVLTSPSLIVEPKIPAVTTQELPQQTNNFLTNPADPIASQLDAKPAPAEANQETKTAAVKQNVQDNSAAIGVSINNIAITPLGFSSYTLALADVAFYPPKEIYRNQRVVDNQRVLRQLGTDRLHQEMIELQYRSVR